jgi:molybdopterin converting factor subunit 1
MRVTIRLFARLRELVGREELGRELGGAPTVGDVWSALAREFPALEPYGSSVSAAVNDDYAPMSRTVADGDEVAFLPPVSGGDGPAAARRGSGIHTSRSRCLTS